MIRRIKLLLIAVVVFGAITASSASAATINTAPGGSITAASLGKLTFSAGSISFRCNWTLGGSLLTSATATLGTRVGSISRVEIASCEGVTLRSINNLPYDLTFLRLLTSGEVTTGVEYNVKDVNFTYAVNIFGIVVNCTYRGTMPVLVRISANLTELMTILTNSFSKSAESSSSCAATGSMFGSFGLSPQQRITLS